MKLGTLRIDLHIWGLPSQFLLFLTILKPPIFKQFEKLFYEPVFDCQHGFTHHVIVVSLLIIGMGFYVGFAEAFAPKSKMEYGMLSHPRLYAVTLTSVILAVSILRVGFPVDGQIVIDIVALIMGISFGEVIVEGY
ncbi:MAG: hypothetical protein QXR63_06290 [Candidatus Bathyarchaeia archaeon]